MTAVLVLCLAACSGKSTSHDDGEGTGGSSGTSGSAGGSGGSARPAKLGLTLLLRNTDRDLPETAGRACPATTGVEWNVGMPLERDGVVIGVDSPTPVDFGVTVADGEHDTQISCVVGADGAFSLVGDGVDPQITPPSGLVSVAFSGNAVPNGEVDVSIYTPITFDIRTAPGYPPCHVTAVHEQSPGALWADFECPALISASEPSLACRASGTVVVEYCETGED
jgi:hypothetical protein